MLKKWVIRIVLFFFISTILSVIFFRFVPVPVTPLMIIRGFEKQEVGEENKPSKKWVPIEEIKNLPLAVVCTEDQRFLDHNGFDFEAIDKAIEYNEKHEKTIGASTISQQTAKNVFLWPGRSWIRKGLEVYFTFLIELLWSKERILEVYLNVIEFGDGIYGAEAASMYYFNQPASQLSREQAASLAVCLPAPLRFRADKLDRKLNRRKNWAIRQMKKRGSLGF